MKEKEKEIRISIQRELEKQKEIMKQKELEENNKKLKQFKINKVCQYNLKSKQDKENINYDEEMKYDDILKTILFGYESNKYLKESSKELIKELINKTKEEKNKIYGNCLNNFAEKQTSELINKLLDLQSEINEKNEGNLKEYKSSQQFKDEIIPQIFNSLYNQMEDRGINSLHLKIIDLMSEIVEGELISLISSDSTKNNLDSKIKKQFERIMSIVEGFNFK